MALKTKSSFFYGFQITENNRYLDFSEGLTIYSVSIPVGSYTFTSVLVSLVNAMNAVSANNYVASYDRNYSSLSISGSTVFSVLGTSGVRSSQSILSTLGMSTADQIGLTSLNSVSQAGRVYNPQFTLQDHIAPENNKKSLTATVSKSASGDKVSVQSFGEERFLECNIKYITEISQGECAKLSDDPNALANVRSFMDHCISKQYVEFMPDIDNKDSFDTFILESTPESQDGTAYRLKELYGQGLPFYFETGVLRFKKVEV